MVPRHRAPAFRECDIVSIAVRHFGKEYAISRAGARSWATDSLRNEGSVTGRAQADDYVIYFADGGEARNLKRSLIHFMRRPERQLHVVQHDSSDAGGPMEEERNR
eukprot:3061517-Pleurochrysis_carterae.AAC.1